jgi:hypothetical protein
MEFIGRMSTSYLTIADALREKGWRHMKRGLEHRAAGREEWAKGSFSKAHRKFERAKLFDRPPLDPILERNVQSLADNIARVILGA